MPSLDEHVRRIRIKNPITQEFNGTFGTYTQQNVEKQRSYNLPEWKTLTEETHHQPPAKRGERRRNQEKIVRGGGNLRARAVSGAPPADVDASKPKRKPGRPRRNPLPAEETASEAESKEASVIPESEPITPSSPAEKPAKKPRGRPSKGGAGQSKSVTSRRLNNTSEAVDYVDEKAFKGFSYRMDGLDEFTPERCAELETHYWKSLGFNQPMYAADMPGSLFEDKTTSWNVAKLENLLDVLGTKVPGVNTAYLYMGMWKATFAWHLEDVDLYSINYIHFGAPKQWYSISQEDARKFERAMKQVWPVDSKNCDQFLRHKTYLISPDVLQKQYNVKVNKLVHYQGEFVITFPYGYHSGYNLGYNCAESVNFATESWLEYGRIARKCNCEADNVWVDVAEIERKLRGEPTPEYYEETDDDDDDEQDDGNLPSPPASVKGQKLKTGKRKRDGKSEATKKKKKIRIKIKVPTRQPCVLCPNENPWEPLYPTDNGKKAHRCCAMYTPETFITSEFGKEKICGVANIDKARHDLKCNFCRSKRGACFQCSAKKCTRAFHATCAIAAGVLVDDGLVPTFGEDGTEYFEEGYDFRCKYHRPRMSKNLNIDSLENNKRIINYAKELKRNDTVQAQYVGGEIFGGLVIENRLGEQTVVVDVLPEGYVSKNNPSLYGFEANTFGRDRVEIEWKWLSVLDPDDSLRPKPSPNALPMPEDMSKRNFSLSNRQDGVPTQDEPFHDDSTYKWHDFYNMHMPPPTYAVVQLHNPMKLKVNIDVPDQLYYYLPERSTENKCFFTDKPGSKVTAEKANFMERVAPKPSRNYSFNPKMPLSTYPNSAGYTYKLLAPNNGPVANRDSKPYVYKPKDSSRSSDLCAVDYQALTNQRNFLAEGNRQSALYNNPQQRQSVAQYSYQPQPLQAPVPLRAFPADQYYSSLTLPAAYRGEYSAFRRQSQGAQTMQRPKFDETNYVPNYQSVSQQKMQQKQGANTASRPVVNTQDAQIPPAALRAPSISTSPVIESAASQTDLGYIQDLQKYPHLMKSFCRRPAVYQSPYPVSGGFSEAYQPLELQKHGKPSHDRKRTPGHTPHTSISSLDDTGRRTSQQWTPPSQIWSRAGFSDRQQPSPPDLPNQTMAHPQKYIPGQQFTQDLQKQMADLPSTASRDGVQARMLRDQGCLPYTSSNVRNRNSFGSAYETPQMSNSPQAPTASPLSGPNTPLSSAPRSILPRVDAGSATMQQPSSAAYGAVSLEGQGDNEMW